MDHFIVMLKVAMAFNQFSYRKEIPEGYIYSEIFPYDLVCEISYITIYFPVFKIPWNCFWATDTLQETNVL